MNVAFVSEKIKLLQSSLRKLFNMLHVTIAMNCQELPRVNFLCNEYKNKTDHEQQTVLHLNIKIYMSICKNVVNIGS
jgi:hypothetical protein